MVIAVLLRGAAKRCKSMEELWQTYDDVGCDLVRDKVRQKKFDRVMSYLVFADYSGLARDAGDPTKIDILARVEPLLHLMGERCRELFETSQTCAVDGGDLQVVVLQNQAAEPGEAEEDPHKSELPVLRADELLERLLGLQGQGQRHSCTVRQ